MPTITGTWVNGTRGNWELIVPARVTGQNGLEILPGGVYARGDITADPATLTVAGFPSSTGTTPAGWKPILKVNLYDRDTETYVIDVSGTAPINLANLTPLEQSGLIPAALLADPDALVALLVPAASGSRTTTALQALITAVAGSGAGVAPGTYKPYLTSTPIKVAAADGSTVYAAAAGDLVRVNTAAGSMAVNLPRATTKWELVVKVMAAAATLGATACTVATTGGDVLNLGGSSIPLRYSGQAKTFVSDGAGTITVQAGDFDKTVNDQLYDAAGAAAAEATRAQAAEQTLTQSVAQNTANITSNATAITQRVPQSRQVANGYGITGGGDLTADRSLGVGLGVASAALAAATGTLTAGQANNILGLALGVGTWLLSATVTLNNTGANMNADLLLSLPAGMTAAGPVATSGRVNGGPLNLSIDAIITVTAAGSVTMQAAPSGGTGFTALAASSVMGAGPATGMTAVRIA